MVKHKMCMICGMRRQVGVLVAAACYAALQDLGRHVKSLKQPQCEILEWPSKVQNAPRSLHEVSLPVSQ